MNLMLRVGALCYDNDMIPIEDWRSYFRAIGPNRCPVFVDMKEIAAKRLRESTSLSLHEIALIVGLNDHASALFLINGGRMDACYGRKKSKDYNNTLRYFDVWIRDGLYPVKSYLKSNISDYSDFKTIFRLWTK